MADPRGGARAACAFLFTLALCLVCVNGFQGSTSVFGLKPWDGRALGVRNVLQPVKVAKRQATKSKWVAKNDGIEFYIGEDINTNWNRPVASGNFGSVYFGSIAGKKCVVKCPVLEEFSLSCFDTERANNIKLSSNIGTESVPWTKMIGEVNVPENINMPRDLARIGIVWEKEGDGATLEDYLTKGKNLESVLNVQEQRGSSIKKELCKSVMGQLLIALEQMHDIGIMHRDVKPSNTLVVPEDKEHPLKIIDFGSSCDWSDPLKRGIGEATFDPMYGPPEKTIQLLQPTKFDVFCVGMTGIRVLFPSLTTGGQSNEWPGGNFQRFAEMTLPMYKYDLKAWMKDMAERSDVGRLSQECAEGMEADNVALIQLLQKLIQKSSFQRPTVPVALKQLGPEWAQRAQAEKKRTKQLQEQRKRETARQRAAEAKREEQEQQERARAEQEEATRRKKAETEAEKASKAEESRLRSILAAGADLFGKKRGATPRDSDIANVVPETWKEQKEYLRSNKLVFKQGEMVVSFRSDGSRRFGKIMLVNGDGTYDVLVERSGGEGAGLFRTDAAGQIGKLATGRSLQEELKASELLEEREKRQGRKDLVKKVKVGDFVPKEWAVGQDYAFSPTASFRRGEVVVAARTDGSLRFGQVKGERKDGTFEVAVEVGGNRVYPGGSLGKIFT